MNDTELINKMNIATLECLSLREIAANLDNELNELREFSNYENLHSIEKVSITIHYPLQLI
jgi:hypothetical protein